jgi:hypothetical protein
LFLRAALALKFRRARSGGRKHPIEDSDGGAEVVRRQMAVPHCHRDPLMTERLLHLLQRPTALIFADLFDGARVRWNPPAPRMVTLPHGSVPLTVSLPVGQPNSIGEYPLDIGTAKRKSHLHKLTPPRVEFLSAFAPSDIPKADKVLRFHRATR